MWHHFDPTFCRSPRIQTIDSQGDVRPSRLSLFRWIGAFESLSWTAPISSITLASPSLFLSFGCTASWDYSTLSVSTFPKLEITLSQWSNLFCARDGNGGISRRGSEHNNDRGYPVKAPLCCNKYQKLVDFSTCGCWCEGGNPQWVLPEGQSHRNEIPYEKRNTERIFTLSTNLHWEGDKGTHKTIPRPRGKHTGTDTVHKSI